MDRTNSVAGRCVPVYNGTGKRTGKLVKGSDGVWFEKRDLDPARHMLRRPPAWATDASHLDILRDAGGRGLRIYTVDGRVWEASLAAFGHHGFKVRRGHGDQIALPLCYWSVVASEGERQLSLRLGDGA